MVGVSQKLAADALSSCAVNPETSVVHFVLAREKVPLPNLNTQAADENQNIPLSSETQVLPSKDLTVASPDPETESETSAPSIEGNSPPLLLAPSMLHCGESTAFIPLSPSVGNLRLSLADLPESVLIKISTFLSTEDVISLRNVNESFYRVLVKNLSELEPNPNLPAPGVESNPGDENIGPNLGLGAKRRMDRVGRPGINRNMVRPLHPHSLRSCI